MKRTVSNACIAAMLSVGAVAFAQTTGQNPTGSSGQAGSATMPQGRQSGERARTDQQITVVGCIMRETDYRQATGAGRGTMGTGVGMGNEFVLTNATMGPAASQTTAAGTGTGTMTGTGTATGATTGTSTGTTGTTTGTAAGTTTGTGTETGTTAGTAGGTSMGAGMYGTVYALTGDREKELEQYAGQRVEIVGTLKDSSGTAMGTGTATGTATGTGTGTTSGTGTATGTGTTSGTTATGTTSGTAGAMQRVGDLKEIEVTSFRAVAGSCPMK